MKPPYIIAEMACSHEGEAELAKKIILSAGEAGANAIQFQVFLAKERIVPQHHDFNLVSSVELSQDQWVTLSNFSRKFFPSLDIIACVYERFSVDFCEKMGVDAYKIHASDLSNPHLLKYVAETGKRIDLSVGCSSLEEIQSAIEYINYSSSSEIWLMYGYQNFPTPPEELHLNYMMKLKHLFELPVCYQDHTDAESDAAFWLPAAALGLGVDILEKHITHERSYKGVDHEAALNPEEFKKFVKMARTIYLAKGCSTPKPFSEEEKKYRTYSRKSIVAGTDLPANIKIEKIHLKYMFTPDLGLQPSQNEKLLGKLTKHRIKAYQTIFECDVNST